MIIQAKHLLKLIELMWERADLYPGRRKLVHQANNNLYESVGEETGYITNNIQTLSVEVPTIKP